jgi:hypothetical protein
MKRVFFALIIGSFCFSGCIEFETGKPKKALYDSTFIKSVQDNVIGGLTFGMSADTVNTLIEEFDRENVKPDRENGKFIGKFQYDFISADYDDGKLYKVSIYGIKNSKAGDTTELEKMMKLKYQDADTAPSVFTVRAKDKKPPFYINNLRTWIIGRKKIVIQEVVNDTNRQVKLLIFRPDIENKVIAEAENQKHQTDRDEAEELKKKNY